MSASTLTSCLLDPSLHSIANALIHAAMLNQAGNEEVAARAAAASEFFVDILDRNIPAERRLLELYESCLKALRHGVFPSSLRSFNTSFDLWYHQGQMLYIETLKSEELRKVSVPLGSSPAIELSETSGSAFTATHQVLDLKDTLDLIIFHIRNETHSGRKTLCIASLVNRSFRQSAQAALWSAYIELSTVEQQVSFAFGCFMSFSRGEDLGSRVKDLRIRWLSAEGNLPVLRVIASRCRNVTALLIHQDDFRDPEDWLSLESIASIHSFLTSFPSLKQLGLCKFSYTPNYDEKILLPPDFQIPFSKLDYFRVQGFSWHPYWPSIVQGLGKSLTHLFLHDNGISSEEIASLANKFPNLIHLTMTPDIDLPTLRTFISTARSLKTVDLNLPFWEDRPGAIDGAIEALSGLSDLEDIEIRRRLSISQVYALGDCPHPLKSFSLYLDDEVPPESYEDSIITLLEKKKTTLTQVYIDCGHTRTIPPTMALVNALASLPQLVNIAIDFSIPSEPLPSFVVELLLTNCKNLIWTDALDVLTKGNSLYEEQYKERLERGRDKKEDEFLDTLIRLGF
jgi:hypothetical protein